MTTAIRTKISVLARLAITAIAISAFLITGDPADAHSGGLDGNGGHYCREAGYNSGKCAPLGSYHCHRAGCVVPGAATPVPEPPAPVVPVATQPPPPAPTPPPPTSSPEPTLEPIVVVTAEPTIEPVEETSETSGVGETVVGLALVGGLGYGVLRVVKSIRGRGRQ